jgi:hypothetical protein
MAFFTSSRSVGAVPTALLLAAAAACSASSDDDSEFEQSSSGAGASAQGAGGDSSGAGGNISVGSGVGGGSGGALSCTQDIDIVFVMDVSTSMGAFLTKLAEEIAVVDAKVKELAPQGMPHYGLVVFVDDTMFANNAQPYTDVIALQQEFQQWATFTASNSQVSGGGYNTTFPENSIDALYDAATKFAWRPVDETLRIVIHTTDDTFWEGPSTQDGVAILHDYKSTVAALQQGQIRAFSFASELGGPTETTDVSAGWFGAYLGEKSIPESTGGGVFELNQVISGQISLSASINQSVIESLCEPYPRPD